MDTQPYSNACYQQLWQDGLAQLSLLLNTQQVEQLQAYLALLQKWNKTYNLTAIRQPQEAIVQHVFDSLSADCMLGDGRVLDVGTGGGTPGIPLAILRPHQSFTLLDSNQKKTTFVKVVKNELGLENVSVEHQRIESYQPQHRFDWVISRAFASMVDFTQGSQHCLMDGGHFLAMKGKSPESELSLIGKSLIMLKIHAVNVPYLNAQRHLVLLQKT